MSNQEEAKARNLLRFIHAQDSGGVYDGTGTYAEALQEVKAGHKLVIGYGTCSLR